MSSRRAAQAALLDDALQILPDSGERNVKDRCYEGGHHRFTAQLAELFVHT